MDRSGPPQCDTSTKFTHENDDEAVVESPVPQSHFRSIFGPPTPMKKLDAMVEATSGEGDHHSNSTSGPVATKQSADEVERLSSESTDTRLLSNGIPVHDSELKTTSSISVSASTNTALHQDSPQLPNPFTFLTSPLVTLYIGGPRSPNRRTYPVQVRFHIHSELLTGISTFFRGAFGWKCRATERGKFAVDEQPTESGTDEMATGFAESREGIINLPEERVEDWMYFCQWLYGRAVLRMVEPLDRQIASGTSGEELEGGSVGGEYPHSGAGKSLTAAEREKSDKLEPVFSGSSRSEPVNLLHHHLIDPPLVNYRRWLGEKRRPIAPEDRSGVAGTAPQADLNGAAGDAATTTTVLQTVPLEQSLTPSETDPTQPQSQSCRNLSSSTTVHTTIPHKQQQQQRRPPPPAFGPLIRLYILADRYDIAGGLREDIVRRVAEVAFAEVSECGSDRCQGGGRSTSDVIGKETRKQKPPRSMYPHFVPDKSDVNRLWRGVRTETGTSGRTTTDTSCPNGAGPDTTLHHERGLKRLILDLYAGMKGRGVFGPSAPSSSTNCFSSVVGTDGTMGPSRERSKGHAHAAEEEEDYDSTFLRDLVVRLLDAR